MKPKKKSCLLIDDDLDDQEIFALALSKIRYDFNCQVANDGLDALKKLEHSTDLPDYIFLDLNMPRMNGKECLKELKRSVRFRNIPVIIYSTSSSLSDINDTKKMGAKEFIIKPFSLNELINKLDTFFLRQPELSAESSLAEPYRLNRQS